jgi:hypothetical protein
LKLKIAGLDSDSRFKYRLRFRLTSKVQAQGSGSKLFEPRLGRFRLRLEVFETVDIINKKYIVS